MADGLPKVTSGTPGLDAVLHGGFLEESTAVVIGGPGSGKTILALQFLAAAEETGLYVGFEERERELRRNATQLGIDLGNVEMLDLSAEGERFFSEGAYTLFTSEEVEGQDLLGEVASAIEETSFDRLVIDPLTELRSFLPDDFQFRRNLSSLINALADRGVTTIFTAQPVERAANADIQYLGNTTIELHRSTGSRLLEVTKSRGSGVGEGRHTVRITEGTGAVVYPKLVPGDHFRETTREPMASGVTSLDELLHGGIERGSVTIISGPSGVGKTTTGTQFLQQAAEDGSRSMGFLFEELPADYRYRCEQLGMTVPALMDAGKLEVAGIESLTQSPDEFAATVREAVEERGVEVVMIDGVAGYRLGVRGDDSPDELTRELHALARYLKRMGVTTILIEEAPVIAGTFAATGQKISYIADNIVFLRYLEVDGQIEKAIGVLKKRFSDFDNTLRALEITERGLSVGEEIRGYRGVMSGAPEPLERGP